MVINVHAMIFKGFFLSRAPLNLFIVKVKQGRRRFKKAMSRVYRSTVAVDPMSDVFFERFSNLGNNVKMKTAVDGGR